MELEEAMREAKIDVMGLAEIERNGEFIINTKENNLLCYKGNISGQRRVGFLINQKWKDKILEFRGITDRIAWIKIKLKEKLYVRVIQVFAFTTDAKEEECGEFYNKLNETIETIKMGIKNKLMIIGDFNAKVGKR